MARREALPRPATSDPTGPRRDAAPTPGSSASRGESGPGSSAPDRGLPDRRASIDRALETLWG